MTGSWGIHPKGRRWKRSPGRAWLVLETPKIDVVQFDGPVLELMTESRTRFDRRLAALGPDVLGEALDERAVLVRLRQDDPTRGIGDALLDQRNVAGIGNIWKSESCFLAGVDPWRPLAKLSDREALGVLEAARREMRTSVEGGGESTGWRVFERAGRPCPRCGSLIRARAQGES